MKLLWKKIWFLIVWSISIIALFYIRTPEKISVWLDLELWFGQIYVIGISAGVSAIMVLGVLGYIKEPNS